MTGYGVPDDDMPDSLPPPPWGSPPFDERDLDALLAGNSAYVPVALRQVADALTALRATPVPAELRGEATAMAEFRALAAFGAIGPGEPARGDMPMVGGGAGPAIVLATRAESHRRPRRHRRTQWHARSSRIGLLASAAAAVIIAAAVAYSGNLPGPAQRLAHITLAAPSPKRVSAAAGSPGVEDKSAAAVPTPSHRPAPIAPSTGQAAKPAAPSPSASVSKASLCDTFIKVFDNRVPGQEPWWKSSAYAKVSAAAGGPERIPAYCAATWAKLTPSSSPRLPNWPIRWPSIPQTGNIGAGNGSGFGIGVYGNASGQTRAAPSGSGLQTPGQGVPNLGAGDQSASGQGAAGQGAAGRSASSQSGSSQSGRSQSAGANGGSDQDSAGNTGVGSGGLNLPVSGSRG